MGTAEVESALVLHHQVAEAAVVGMPHDIKGQGIYAYVTCVTGAECDEALRRELVQWVRKEIGPIATPDVIQFAPALPKTRSGKIMRRILRKIAENDVGNSWAIPRRWPTRRGRRSAGEPAQVTTASGQCLCGAFRFTVEGPLENVRLCHCDFCRRGTAAPFRPTAAFRSTFLRRAR